MCDLFAACLTLYMICCRRAPEVRRDLWIDVMAHKMKPARIGSSLFLAVFTCCIFSDTLCVSPPYKEFFFEQRADHFNFYERNLEKPTFKQRYLIQGRSTN